MIKKIFFIFFIAVLSLQAIESAKLQWRFEPNSMMYIDKYTKQEILKNGTVVRRRAIKDLVVLKAQESTKNLYPLSGTYRSYEADLNSKNLEYKLTDETHLIFSISNTGIYIVPENKIQPSIRDIPYFPQKEIKPGDRWSHIGYEILGFDPPIKIPVQVMYQAIGFETNQKVNCLKILFYYNINHYTHSSRKDTPNRFFGYVGSTLWYDYKNEVPVYTENNYDITMSYPNTVTMEYRGSLFGYYKKHKIYTSTDKLRLKKTIEKNIGPQKDISVTTNAKGVVISLGEIFFDYDSARIKKKYNANLDIIGRALKDHHKYEVIIEGHSDDLGSDEYNRSLSEARAQNVLKFFLLKNYIKSKQGSFVGLGENNPKYPNTSESNRQKNRRVDIIIKQE